jgi:ABC-type amino acid transport substrate-binding protein
MDVRHGKAVAALVDPDLGAQIQQENPDMVFVQIPVPMEYQSRGNGIAIHHDNQMLARNVATAIAAMKEDGFIAERENHWHIERLR